jgi:serine/threonine protein kinase
LTKSSEHATFQEVDAARAHQYSDPVTALSQHPDPWIGEVLDGRYRVLDLVGRGGMGVVYRVEHVRIGKIAAMKLLHRRLVSDVELLRRFHVEAEAISRLNHPNIVQVFDFGEVDSIPYLVMEYLHGENLGAVIKRDGPLRLRRCVPLLVQVCDALTEAHELSIVHRDLKPENIQISRTRAGKDHVKVVDFGLAKLITAQNPNDSTAGNLVGTPYYMAPEQIRGQKADHRVDIYALGAMTYKLLTGKHAFTANTPMGVLTKHMTEEVVEPSRSAPELGISKEVDAVVLRAMTKRPEERFSHIGEFKRALLRAANRSLSQEVSLLGDKTLQHIAANQSAELAKTETAPLRRASDTATARASQPAAVVTPQALEQTPPRLTRADLAFERRLHRGRRLRLMFLLLMLFGGIGAGFYFLTREKPVVAPNREIEPNNTTRKATLLARGKKVSGQIGKRPSKHQPDVDFFKIDVTSPVVEPQQLHAKVSGLPNIDLTLQLYDSFGESLLQVDSTGVGGSEQITNWPVMPGTYYLLVREYWTPQAGRLPSENISDSYTLEVDWRVQDPSWEKEPNDNRKLATKIELERPVKGYLGAADDKDVYRVMAPPGKLEGVVSELPSVDIVLELWKSGAKKALLVDEQGLSKGETIVSLKSDGKKPVYVVVRRKNDKKREQPTIPSVDKPYSIKLWIQK